MSELDAMPKKIGGRTSGFAGRTILGSLGEHPDSGNHPKEYRESHKAGGHH
jgi:hypothetical protein